MTHDTNRRQVWSLLPVTGVALWGMIGYIIMQHLAERAAIVTLSWGDLAWMLLLSGVVGVVFEPALIERFPTGWQASGPLSTRHLLLLVGGLLGLALVGMLLAPLLPAALIWPWPVSVAAGLLASVLLVVRLHHDPTRARLPSWRSEGQMGAGLIAATIVGVTLWTVVHGPVWSVLAAWLAAVALVSSWLWSMHLLARITRPV